MAALNNERRIYSLIVSGERFTFTRDQLESDPGNYFATFFFGDFAEARSGCTELIIEKEPKLFKLIQAHLKGYTILPLSASSIPEYMTHETALTNLMADAQFYGLEMLVETLQEFKLEQHAEKTTLSTAVQIKPKRYKIATENRRGKWIFKDIAEGGFMPMLQRALSSSDVQFIDTPPKRDGYTLVISWVESRGEGILRSDVCFALLESST
ncbi:hypothetical protein CPB86DRAFT_789396 [Serendipita vermifera]|nr:hypothetical protein CPB86DRAFT_789396 [Serendipita vermifera]